jgi:hypothetical protein
MLALVVDDDPKVRAYIRRSSGGNPLKPWKPKAGTLLWKSSIRSVDISISSSATFRCRMALD